MARHTLTRSRTFGIGLAIAALTFAACGHHSNSTPTAVPTATPISTAGPTSAPCVISLGIAYEPDGGSATFHGIQVSHFEGNDQTLCGGVGPTATPMGVTFSNSVDVLAIGNQTIDAVAIERNGAGGYSLVQDVFGATAGILVPAGTPYDVNAEPPTPVPTTGATATPLLAPLIPDVTSASLIDDGATGVAMVVGPAANPPALVALTSLSNAPPSFGLSVPYTGATYTHPTGPDLPREIVRISTISTTSGPIALVRGQTDLLVYGITLVGSGYQFNETAEDATLGTGASLVPLRGKGNIALDPADASRALIAGTTAGGSTTITLLTGLPATIGKSNPLTLPAGATIRSMDIASNGERAVVGTDVGIFIITGVNSSTLALLPPFRASPLNAEANAIPYTDCNGGAQVMTTIYSVGLSAGSIPNLPLDNYLVALGTAPGVSCPSGNNASLVAIAFSPTTGSTPVPTASPVPTATPTPGATTAPTPTAPAIFVQNNMIAPPAGSDLLIVR